MGIKFFVFLGITAVITAISCGSSPSHETPTVREPEQTPIVQEPVQTARIEPTPQPPQVEEEPFNPSLVSRQQYNSTLTEVKVFIEELNRVISNRNYNAWRAALSDSYFQEISSQENLKQISEQPAMTTRRIVLRNAQDYFTHVVVPSRANSRADDIEFVERYRVKVFSVNTTREGEEQRLRLYDLEKIGNSWKIIN